MNEEIYKELNNIAENEENKKIINNAVNFLTDYLVKNGEDKETALKTAVNIIKYFNEHFHIKNTFEMTEYENNKDKNIKNKIYFLNILINELIFEKNSAEELMQKIKNQTEKYFSKKEFTSEEIENIVNLYKKGMTESEILYFIENDFNKIIEDEIFKLNSLLKINTMNSSDKQTSSKVAVKLIDAYKDYVIFTENTDLNENSNKYVKEKLDIYQQIILLTSELINTFFIKTNLLKKDLNKASVFSNIILKTLKSENLDIQYFKDNRGNIIKSFNDAFNLILNDDNNIVKNFYKNIRNINEFNEFTIGVKTLRNALTLMNISDIKTQINYLNNLTDIFQKNFLNYEQIQEIMKTYFYFIKKGIEQDKNIENIISDVKENFLSLIDGKNFDYMQLEQIRLGFENGLSVEQIKFYVKNSYNWAQMMEIRDAFENGFSFKEIEKFSNPDFNAVQMKIIKEAVKYRFITERQMQYFTSDIPAKEMENIKETFENKNIQKLLKKYTDSNIDEKTLKKIKDNLKNIIPGFLKGGFSFTEAFEKSLNIIKDFYPELKFNLEEIFPDWYEKLNVQGNSLNIALKKEESSKDIKFFVKFKPEKNIKLLNVKNNENFLEKQEYYLVSDRIENLINFNFDNIDIVDSDYFIKNYANIKNKENVIKKALFQLIIKDILTGNDIFENRFYNENFNEKQLKNIEEIAQKIKQKEISKEDFVKILKDDKKFLKILNKTGKKNEFPNI